MPVGPLQTSDPAVLTVAVASLAALGAAAVALWLISVRLRRMEKRLEHLDRLEPIQGVLAKFQDNRAELDLRRLEHVLIDIRDGQKRVEDRVLAVLESGRGASAQLARTPGALEPVSSSSAAALADRIVTRLLALGYERVQLVTPMAKLAELVAGAGGDGEVSVEARREGAACKGRVVIRGGAIADLQIQSAYSTFP